MPSSSSLAPGALRKKLRQARAALSVQEQEQAALAVYRKIQHDLRFQGARHIAFYLPSDGELSPLPLLQQALNEGKHCYLPVLSPSNKEQMLFVRYQSGDPLTANRWGILEPVLKSSHRRAAWALDLIFVPLVGFDRQANRMGMGKGFYDRSLAQRRRLQRSTPQLIGLAHDCQLTESLPVRAWDIPMDRILTPADRFPA